MNQNKLIITVLIGIALSIALINKPAMADDLSSVKMEQATKEILEIFKSKSTDKTKELKKYISKEWAESTETDISKFKINTYSPDHYTILTSTSNICVASLGSDTWEHILIFKFVDESGVYRVIPLGVSKTSSDYIDPWFYVKEFICKTK